MRLFGRKAGKTEFDAVIAYLKALAEQPVSDDFVERTLARMEQNRPWGVPAGPDDPVDPDLIVEFPVEKRIRWRRVGAIAAMLALCVLIGGLVASRTCRDIAAVVPTEAPIPAGFLALSDLLAAEGIEITPADLASLRPATLPTRQRIDCAAALLGWQVTHWEGTESASRPLDVRRIKSDNVRVGSKAEATEPTGHSAADPTFIQPDCRRQPSEEQRKR